jgi:hypothetical protein
MALRQFHLKSEFFRSPKAHTIEIDTRPSVWWTPLDGRSRLYAEVMSAG